MKKLKTNDNILSKINQRKIEDKENLDLTFNNMPQASTNDINSYRIDSLNQYRNMLQDKYNSKIPIKQKIITIRKKKHKDNEIKKNEKDKSKELDKDKSKKKYNLLKNRQNKTKKVDSFNKFNNKLNKNDLKKEKKIHIQRKNKKENDKDKIDTVENNEYILKDNFNEKKKEEKDYNGGEKVIKQIGEKEKNLIFSKINRNKKMNYYNNSNSKITYKSKDNNSKEKTYTEGNGNHRKINKERSKLNSQSYNKIEDIHFIKKLKVKHRNKNIENMNNISEYQENGGIDAFNKSYEIIKNHKNSESKNHKTNIKNDSISYRTYEYNKDNKSLRKVAQDNYITKAYNKKDKIVDTNINSPGKKIFTKNKTYKKINLTLNQNKLFIIPQQEKTIMFTTNSSRSGISYNEKLEQKKKLLGIHLKCKEYKMIKKKMEEDLSTKDTKRSCFVLYKNQNRLEENKTIRIFDEKNNSIKILRKRSGLNNKYKRNLEIKYDNELNKTREEKNDYIDFDKIRYIHKRIGFSIMPKGLDLMRKLTEM